MTDPLPAEVRQYLQALADNQVIASPGAEKLLAKYPKPQPEPWPFPLPPRFHDHAEWLRQYSQGNNTAAGDYFRDLADDIDPEVPDA